MQLPLPPHDKLGHFFWGCAISTIGGLSALLAGFSLPQAALYGVASAAIGGLAKEIADAYNNWRATGSWKSGPHSVDPWDAVATCAGGLPSLILAYAPAFLAGPSLSA